MTSSLNCSSQGEYLNLEQLSRSRENRTRIATGDTMIFKLWFSQVEHLPTSTLWYPNGRGCTQLLSSDPMIHLNTIVFFLSRCFLCEESPQVGVSHPYNIDHNENHKSKGGKETHANARVATTTCTQVKKGAHKHSATSLQLNKCSNLSHNDPNVCLWSLGVLGCSMEAWCSAPCT
jgi:hypothetical protein